MPNPLGITVDVDTSFGLTDATYIEQLFTDIFSNSVLAGSLTALRGSTILVTGGDQSAFTPFALINTPSYTEVNDELVYYQPDSNGNLSDGNTVTPLLITGIQLNVQDVAQEYTTHVSPTLVGTTTGYMSQSPERVLFHELTHNVVWATDPLFFLSPSPTYDVNEAVAVAAENYIYAPTEGGASRIGHLGGGAHSVLNLGPSYDPETPFLGISVSESHGSIDGNLYYSFSGKSIDGGTIQKDYFTDSTFANYVTLTGSRSDIISSDGALSETFDDVLSGALTGTDDIPGEINDISTSLQGMQDASNLVSKISPSLYGELNGFQLSAFDNVDSLSDERYTDYFSSTKTNISLVGPASSTVLNGSVPYLELEASTPSILIGASGYWNLGPEARGYNNNAMSLDYLVGSDAGHNMLIAGSGVSGPQAAGYNELIAGKAGDILVGGSGNDNLVGNIGNDIFYTSGGNDIISGGGGDDIVVLDPTTSTVTATSSGAVLTGYNGSTQVSGVSTFVGSSSQTDFYGDGKDIFISGSGGGNFYLQSGDTAIADPDSNAVNNYYVTVSDIIDGSVSIVGFKATDNLFIDGKLFTGSTVTTRDLGKSFDSNGDIYGQDGLQTTGTSSWGVAYTNPILSIGSNAPFGGVNYYHYWGPGTGETRNVSYVKEAGSTAAGDIVFSDTSTDSSGDLTTTTSFDISLTGWEQGYGGINFVSDSVTQALFSGSGYASGDGNHAVTPDSPDWQTGSTALDTIANQISTALSAAGSGQSASPPYVPGISGNGAAVASQASNDDPIGAAYSAYTLEGDASANTLDTVGAYPIVQGGGGGDTIQFNVGYGTLWVDEEDTSTSPSNVLQFGAGIDPSAIAVSGSAGGDIVITVSSTDKVVLEGALNSTSALARGVQEVTFADGTVWTYADLLADVETPTLAGSGIYGDGTANTLDTAGLATAAVGGGGGDTFLYNAGYGDVTIDERDPGYTGTNIVQFGAGLDPASASVYGKGDGSLVIDFGDGDKVTLENELLYTDATDYGADQVDFADGTVWDSGTLMSMADTASSSNLSLYGTLYGDDLWGGGYASSLTGFGGGDVFEVYSGDQAVTIYEADSSAVPSNEIDMYGFDPSDVTVQADAQGDLMLLVDGALQVTIAGALNSTAGTTDGVQRVVFDDGTVWTYQDLLAQADTASSANSVLYGDSGANTFDPAGIATSIVGKGGGDTIIYDRGYGALSVDEMDTSATPANTLQFGAGIAASDVSVSGDAFGDLILSLGDGDVITLVGALDSSSGSTNGVQSVTFADGSSWTYADLLQHALTPTAGGTIYGDDTANTLDTGGVASTAVGNGGGDTFVYNAGYGALDINEKDLSSNPNNVLTFGQGIDPDNVSVSATADGSIILTMVGADVVTLNDALLSDGVNSYGVQTISFANGTTWTYSDLLTELSTPTSGGALTIYGDRTSNTLDPDAIANTVVGNGGGDTILFNAGYGAVTIDEQDVTGDPDNVLQMGSGIDPSEIQVSGDSAGDIILEAGNGDQVVLKGALDSSLAVSRGVQEVNFANGTVWQFADLLAKADTPSATNTTLYGDAGANVLDGAGVAHELVGGGGGDDFIFDQGYGALEIEEQDASAGDDNKLTLGAGISPDAIAVSADSAGDVILSLGGDDQVTIANELDTGQGLSDGVQEVDFSDGTSWNYADLLAKADTPTASNTTLIGDIYANVFDSDGVAHGIVGGGGGDRFIYDRGYGTLIIDEQDSDGDSLNTLAFGANIAPADVNVSTDNNGDILLALGSGDVVTLLGAMTSTVGIARGVQRVTFANGQSWSAQQLYAFASGSWSVSDDGQETDVDEAVNYAGLAPTIDLAFASTDTTVAFSDDRTSLTLTSANGTTVSINDILRTGADAAQSIQFSDGVTWTLAEAMADASNAGSVANYEVGTPGSEAFNFGQGVQDAIGLGGGDSFRYDVGDGLVSLEEADTGSNPSNVLNFGPGISISDLTVSTDGTNLILSMPNGDEVMITEALESDASTTYGVQQVNFADGTSVSYQQLLAIADTGSPTNDGTLYGDAQGDVINPAGYSHFILDGGGNDTILYGQGYGALEIGDTAQTPGSSAGITFGAGITPDDVQIVGDASNAQYGSPGVVDINVDGSTIQIDDELSSSTPIIDHLTFADGTVWTYADILDQLETPVEGGTIFGDASANTLDTQGLANVAIGNGGGDTFVYGRGYGALSIIETDTSADPTNRILFDSGIAPTDVNVTRVDYKTFNLSLGNGDTISFYVDQINDQADGTTTGVQKVEFSDGTIWDYSTLLAMALTPDADNTSLYGDVDANVIDSEGIATYVYGGGGGDTFIYNVGYGALTIDETEDNGATNSLELGSGISENAVTLSLSGNDVTLNLGGGDQIKLLGQAQPSYYFGTAGVEQIEFADGTIWDRADIANKVAEITTTNQTRFAKASGGLLAGGSGNDTLYGESGNDILDGRRGNDTLYGGSGDDTYLFSAGDGQDTIVEDGPTGSGGNDTVSFDSSITPDGVSVSSVNGSDVKLSYGSGDSITIRGQLNDANAQIENVDFSDGTTWDLDEINGRATATPVTLDGSASEVEAQSGDQFVVRNGLGNVSIDDFSAAGAGHDYLQFSTTQFSDWAHLLGATQQVGSDLVITIDSSDSVRLTNFSFSDFSRNDVEFRAAA